MKTLKISFLSLFLVIIAQVSFAQSKTEKFAVSGECGMCKNKIEAAAKKAGASYALWNEATKELTVKYNTTSSNAAKIQESIAATGYDTPGAKATDEAYNKLHSCCKYERTTAAKESCCSGEGCTKEDCATCCKGGKCTSGNACCTDGGCKHDKKEGTHAKAEGAAACCKKA